jgi:hypothetical protein
MLQTVFGYSIISRKHPGIPGAAPAGNSLQLARKLRHAVTCVRDRRSSGKLWSGLAGPLPDTDASVSRRHDRILDRIRQNLRLPASAKRAPAAFESCGFAYKLKPNLPQTRLFGRCL